MFLTVSASAKKIWFQNRRQNDRRKSKPYDPHELLGPSSSEPDSSQSSNTEDSELAKPEMSSRGEQLESQDQEVAPSEAPVEPSTGELASPSSGESETRSENRPRPDPDPDQSLNSSQTSLASLPQEPSDPEESIAVNNDCGQAKEGSEDSENLHAPETPPASAKRKRAMSDIQGGGGPRAQQPLKPNTREYKSPPSLRLSLSLDGEARVRKEGDLTPSPPRGRNALRIAMSSDGKAVIRAGNEPSPSKNRISMFSNRAPRLPGLRRSSSAVIFGTPHASSADRNKIFGRSRDPRNWESFFDTDARSALSTTPSSSQSVPSTHSSPALSGSQPRRSLTRSFSAARLNMPPPRSTTVCHPFGEKRRKLSRTVSSLGRLETSHSAGSALLELSRARTNDEDPKSSKHLHGFDECDGGDSDKENWIPGTQTSRRRRMTTSRRLPRRSILTEAYRTDGNARRSWSSVVLANHPRGTPDNDLKHGKSNAAESVSELGPEVTAFMAAARDGTSQDEDLDCIQGLLSLSQGAWR